MTERRLPPEEIALREAMRTALERCGMTQKELSERSGVAQSVVSSVLTGKARMSAGSWRKVCATLSLDYDKIINGTATLAGADCIVIREDKAQELKEVLEQGERVLEQKEEGVHVRAEQEDLYRVFLFAEERLADNLTQGTQMPPEQLYKLMTAMYALRDACLVMRKGETPSVITQA